MNDPLIGKNGINNTSEEPAPRQMYVLEETGFNEVPRKFRRFYRKWGGPSDLPAANEVVCPVCKIVIRSLQELRVGDKVYCMPCMSRLIIEEENGMLVAKITY